MSIFDSLGRGSAHQQTPQQAPQMNPAQMMQQLQGDPAGVLRKAGLNVPAGMTSPQEMVNYLVQSGQVPQARLQLAQQLMLMARTGRR